MHHHCAYFHDDELLPAELREALEESSYDFFLGSTPEESGCSAVAQSGEPRTRALHEMTRALFALASPVRRLTEGNGEISQRISHDLVHQLGHVFADSNEAAALGALERLRNRLAGRDARSRLAVQTSLGLHSPRAERLCHRGNHESRDLRREALEQETIRELDLCLDRYERRVYRSMIRSHIPGIAKDLLRDSRELTDVSEKMQHYFGISSGRWDLRKGSWRQVPWDLFAASQNMLDSDASIRALAEILGRGPGRNAGDRQTEKTVEVMREKTVSHREYLGRSEILGVEFGDDINILLPGEYTRLLDSDSELRFFKELLEGELLVARYRREAHRSRVERVKALEKRVFDEPQGPLIICIDTSGSMAGWPEQVAKALSMALIRICWQQKRQLYAVLFSTEIMEMDLSDLNSGIDQLSAFMSMEFRGGTDLRPALRASVETIKTNKFKNADLLIVSDFRVPKIMIKQSRALESLRRDGGNRVHALTVGLHPVIDNFNMFDSQWHYRISRGGQGLGVTGLVEV